MKTRCLVLVILLILRFSLGFVDSSKFYQNSRLRVTGNVDRIYQKDTKCIIVVGRFWIDYRSECKVYIGNSVSIVGRVNGGVIDRILGRLWLDSAELFVLDKPSVDVLEKGALGSLFLNINNYCVGVYRRYVPEPEAGLVAGIVLGYKKDIGQVLYNLMVKSGTIHIAVASGYNIMLVGGTVIAFCFWFLRRKWASVVAILTMLFYALLAGGEPPVIRAVIMGSIVFIAALVGRKSLSWWILLVAGWAMILVEPLLLVDASFQLSMAASIGLMVVEPTMVKFLSLGHEKLTEILSGTGLLTSISTMILTGPIIWWHFGRMSLIGIVSNVLILPLVPILMITGILMQVLPWVFAWPTYVVAHWMVVVIRFFGS